jgi:hypothetical protein
MRRSDLVMAIWFSRVSVVLNDGFDQKLAVAVNEYSNYTIYMHAKNLITALAGGVKKY